MNALQADTSAKSCCACARRSSASWLPRSCPETNVSDREGDQTDQASATEDREFSWINRQRAQALLNQIEQALARIENGTYGYCEDTGEPIDLRRLEAQPPATWVIPCPSSPTADQAQAARERRGR